MPEERMVGELMVPISKYPTVYDSDTLREAILTLKKYLSYDKEQRSLLVFSKTKKIGGENELVGILTVRDILEAIKKNASYRENTELMALSWTFFYRKDPLSKFIVTRVGEVIRPLVNAFIQSDQNVTTAIRLMMKSKINILPVLEGKKVVGIIRALDILEYIGELV